MAGAFRTLYPSLEIVPFPNVGAYLAAGLAERIDMIVYHSISPSAELAREVAALRRAGEECPVVLMADAVGGASLKCIRDALRNGASGYICTRTSSVSSAWASLLFVRAGGTFAPLELLSAERSRADNLRERTGANGLNAQQLAILAQIKKGKSNKAIARELGMSEAVVRRHIRTIRRLMAAPNRTRSALITRELPAAGGDPESGPAPRRDAKDEGPDGSIH
jgi:DNA-binding NarL/FixJ family response regulator